MFGFGKKKHAAEVEEAKTEEAVEAAEETTEAEEIEAEGTEADAPEVIKYDRVNGPHDIEEVTAEDLEDYVDLGALRIKLLDGMNLRLETERRNRRGDRRNHHPRRRNPAGAGIRRTAHHRHLGRHPSRSDRVRRIPGRHR